MIDHEPQVPESKNQADLASTRRPLPPFTRETVIEKVRLAEDGWNSREPEKVVLAYTIDSRWRDRPEHANGSQAIIGFLKRKWAKELDYRLIKELRTFVGNRVVVRFAYEFHDDSGNWFRSFSNENWEFDEHGLMKLRLHASMTFRLRSRSVSITGHRAPPRYASWSQFWVYSCS
jgi:uncharacterized protein